MAKYNYNDTVYVRDDSGNVDDRGRKAWIVSIFESRPGPYFDKFAEGVVYSVEFEDGSSNEIHESDLDLVEKASPATSDPGL